MPEPVDHDPIRFEVLRYALVSPTEEMAATIRRAAALQLGLRGKFPLLPPAELAEIGYPYVLQADVLYAVAGALEKYFGELEATGTYGSAIDMMVDFDAFNDLIGLADVEAADARYDRGRATE